LALAGEGGPAHPELAQPIIAGLPDLLAEVALAARREQARSLGDVLLRRTRLGLLAARQLVGEPSGAAQPGQALADGNVLAPVRRVAEVMARELNWSGERVALELTRFADEARAEGIVADTNRPERPETLDTPATPMP
jgi:glycerol-3-phosphate dehydrogenase